MNCLSIGELAQFSGGRLRLSQLPPLGGYWEPIRRIQTEVTHIKPGDVYWPQSPGLMGCDEAFIRGALGVVCQTCRVEPWAGRFTLQVDSLTESLVLAAAAARQQYRGCVVASSGLDRKVERELVGRLEDNAARYCFFSTESAGELARAIIHLDEQRPISVFSICQTTVDARLGIDLHLTADDPPHSEPPAAARVMKCCCPDSISAAVAAIQELTEKSKQPEPCKALPSMLDLRESGMPTLLGRSDDLADRWYLGRPPWQVLPGRA